MMRRRRKKKRRRRETEMTSAAFGKLQGAGGRQNGEKAHASVESIDVKNAQTEEKTA